MSRGGLWRILGIPATDDVKAIRKAYADRLRAMDIDRDAAAYAALRDARDTALHLARQKGASASPAFDGGEIGVSASDLAAEASPDIDEAPGAGRERSEGPDLDFIEILFPGGEYSAEPLTDDEWANADAALARIVEDAREGELARQHMADMWVADCLARAWPRSSMLLEHAAAAFDWEKERGQIHERPAQAFLNARLRGMRFLADLERREHWAHNAWKELSRSGKKGLFGRFRANPQAVRTLLSVVRENFPELETYLDREKVQSWDAPVSSPWFGTGSIIVTLFIAVQLLGMCSRIVDTASREPLAPAVTVSGPELDAQREELAQRIFGAATTYSKVRDQSPTLARSIDAEARAKDDTDTEIFARRWIFATAPKLGFEQLVRLQQLRLEYALLARREAGTDACAELLAKGILPVGTALPPDLREREQALARELLEAGDLHDLPQGSGESSANIPGNIMVAAVQASGLALEKARMVADGGGTAEERCLFRTALMQEVLRQPGRVDVDLLRLL